MIRRALLARGWDTDGTLIENDESVAVGRDALSARIAADLDDPGFSVRPIGVSRIDHHGRVTGAWRITSSHRPSVVESFTARALPDGRLKLLTAALADHPPGGSRWARLADTAIANPAAYAALLGAAIYFALRLPVGLFYAPLGATPDEVGLGPQVLVPQSAIWLVITLTAPLVLTLLTPALRAIWRPLAATGRLREPGHGRRAAATVALTFMPLILLAPGVALLVPSANSHAHAVGGRLAFRGTAAVRLDCCGCADRPDHPCCHRRGSRCQSPRENNPERGARRGRGLAHGRARRDLFLGFFGKAVDDAARVRSGGTATSPVFPWRALPAQIDWKTGVKSDPAITNDCRSLRLLGHGDGQYVLYDSRHERVVRVPAVNANVVAARHCWH